MFQNNKKTSGMSMLFLVGDVGATKTLLAIYEGRQCVRKELYMSRQFSSLEEAIERFLSGEKIAKACFGVAGPVIEQVCEMTNLSWIIDGAAIGKKFSIPEVTILNDMTAHAYGIQEDVPVYILNEGKKRKGNRCLIAAGTGLGEALLFFDGKAFIPIPSEGGRVDFSPRDEREVELFFYLKEKWGHVGYEKVLSGKGIVQLYQFLIDRQYYKESPLVKEKLKKGDPAAVIAEKLCPASAETLRWFCSLYGAEAGNLALKMFATGGVFVGGGIAPKILEEIKRGDFMRAFTEKGGASFLLKEFPVSIILDLNTAVNGLAYYCYEK